MKNLLDLIEEYGIELKPIGKDLYRGYCKIHEDKAGGKPQFTYYPATESWFCFRCNLGGDAIRLVAEMEHLSYAEAKKKLIGTEQEQLQTLKDDLENLDLEISSTYNLQLNFSLRPKFRELFYKYPNKSEEILHHLKQLDTYLSTPISFEKMTEVFNWYKQVSDNIGKI